MKKNMKKLLVIVMALMPSLSICTFAQTPGGGPAAPDPDYIPVKETPAPNPTPGPRIMSVGPDDIPVTPVPTPDIPSPRYLPNDNDGGPIDFGLGTPRPRSGNGGGGHLGEPIAIKGSNPRPRSGAETPECYHYQGVVYIVADNSITYINASVTRYADNQVWSNAAGTNTLSITASPYSGVYLLELTLSNGLSYIGEYTIE